MSTPVVSRPLSLVPFIAADAVLLGTAFLIAWRTPEALAGGPLLGVIVCTGLGAVLGVLPFIINDAREREAALAERQREWAELVTSSTASASRWGAQWAAAATGLEDATKLASRSIAVAEQLPVSLQEKVEALVARLDRAEAGTQAGEERAGRLIAEQAAVQAAILAAHELAQAAAKSVQAERTEQDAAQVAVWAARVEHMNAVVARVEQMNAVVTRMEQALAGREQADAGVTETLRNQHAAFAAVLAELPVAAARVEAQRTALDERVTAAPAQIEAGVNRVTAEAEGRLAQACALIATQVGGAGASVEARLATASTEAGERLAQTADAAVARLERSAADAETRLGATTETLTTALTARMGEVETALGALIERLKSVEFPVAAAASVAPVPAETAEESAEASEPVVVAETVIAAPVVEADSVEAPIVEPAVFTGIVDTPETEAALVIPAPEAETTPDVAVVVEAKEVTKPIMDPFYIPKNGYSALADAMDLGDA